METHNLGLIAVRCMTCVSSSIGCLFPTSFGGSCSKYTGFLDLQLSASISTTFQLLKMNRISNNRRGTCGIYSGLPNLVILLSTCYIIDTITRSPSAFQQVTSCICCSYALDIPTFLSLMTLKECLWTGCEFPKWKGFSATPFSCQTGICVVK